MKEIECRITGRVQLVMYRDFAQRKARALGIVGSVENMSDGSVKLVAQGEETKLNIYIEELKKGSIFSRVDVVEVVWKAPTHTYQQFLINY